MISPSELKKRYEKGGKQQKRVQASINKQLRRKCVLPNCNYSLSFERANRIYCPKHNSTYAKAQRKASNRAKKKRYYEKKGIKFNKTIRKRDGKPGLAAAAKGSAVEYTGQNLLYENYKEPLKPIEKGKGHGYYGTVAQTDDKEYIQCHVCGHLFMNLGGHLRMHKLTAREYKDEYQLSRKTALVSDRQREKMQQQVFKPGNKKLPDHLKEYNHKVQTGQISHKGTKKRTHREKRNDHYSMEWRNERGLCPDQVLEKIQELADELGQVPSQEEFAKRHKGRYIHSIRYLHGSWVKAVGKLGMKSRKELKEPDNTNLLEALIDFQKQYGRIPMTSDFSRGLLRSRGLYISRFGSLNNARIEAGLNAVVPMPFGQIKELTPEEYLQYRNGHGLSKEAVRARNRRRKLQVGRRTQ